jgi:hypothetical protein
MGIYNLFIFCLNFPTPYVWSEYDTLLSSYAPQKYFCFFIAFLFSVLSQESRYQNVPILSEYQVCYVT